MTTIPDWLSSTLASDATGGAGALPFWIRALSPAATVAGPALVVEVSRDDNRPMREVPAAVTSPGTVLVVAGAAESRTAILGDLVARELMTAGVVAVVTDGLIRDSREVAQLGLAVWARGTTPVASVKNGPGQVGGAVTLADVEVHDGDLVIADADGVVVWPGADVDTTLAGGRRKRSRTTSGCERRVARASPTHERCDRYRRRVVADKLPIQMLHDRVLVTVDTDVGERRSNGGIVIPATAQMGKRLAWAEAVATGSNVRTVQVGDRVLYDPEERAEIELHGSSYVLLRERDIHALASERLDEPAAPGLYL